MLTRRHIRIKVMQSVYSFTLGDKKKLEEEIVFFKESVAQSFDLYLLQLALFKAIKSYTDEQLAAYEKHRINRDENFQMLTHLSRNKILIFIDQHPQLQQHLKNKKNIRWDLEFTFLKELLNEITSSKAFESYYKIKEPTVQEDLKLIMGFFKEIVAPSSYLYSYLEDQQLTWIDDLPVVNTFMMKMLKQLHPDKLNSLQFPRPTENKEDLDFGISLLETTLSKEEQLLKELEGKTPNWDADRIAKLDQVILKIAIAELLYFSNIPPKVTLNEYLEIAKDYSTPNSNHFVNGVLDKLVREFQNEKRMVKEGRGLH
jgi:N utilization substance protein B